MPQKSSARVRSREQLQRAWGTRFDSLTTSPTPPSPPSTPGAEPAQLARVLSRDLFGTSDKRDWADDHVPASLTPMCSPLVDAPAAGTARKDTAKMPHNASVFVGSLPSNVDERDIAQLLGQHLAQFANIQNIKIIHDSKGGVCAFVQCENAAQATQIVSQAQSNPQPFMGRYLRYETARAFRSLWISYRTPMHFAPCASDESDVTDIVDDDNGVKGRWVKAGLPDTMRIWKPRDARYPIVSYRGEACNMNDVDASASDTASVFDGKGVLFSDLKFDADTIRKMAAAFGPLESFKPYMPSTCTFGEEPSVYPPGHDSVRSVGMDLGVWEVKWGHRDDCVTALTTLRRVPHLAVSWANPNQANYSPTPRQVGSRQGYSWPPTSPRYAQSYSPRDVLSPVLHSRPFLLLDRPVMSEGFCDALSSPTFARSPTGTLPLSPALGRRGNESARRSGLAEEENTEDGWTVVGPQNITRAILSSVTDAAPSTPDGEDGETRLSPGSPKWSERDFPPLKIMRGETEEKGRKEEKRDEMPASPSAISLEEATSSKPTDEQARPVSDDIPSGDASPISTVRNIPRALVLHRRSLSNPVSRLQIQDPDAAPQTQTAEIPLTPELANTSLSQTPTSAQPVTPMYHTIVPLTVSGLTGQEHVSQRYESEEVSEPCHRREREIDPKTVFVGGLEPFGPIPWDENRLKTIFQRYGEVQEVRLINTTAKKTAFAFVTFTDEQSPLRAIRAEHNRNYDGRQIRVQLRDMHANRGGFRFRGRGMGRPRHLGLEPHISNFDRQVERDSLGISRTNQAFEQILVQTEGERASMPFRINTNVHQHLVSSASGDTDSVTLFSSKSFETNPEADISRESDTRTAVSLTPSPSALGVSASASAIVAPVTPQSAAQPVPVGYYPPHAWASPYGAPMHYPFSLGAYGGMIPPVPMQYATATQGTDASGAAVNTPPHWGPLYRTAVSYAPYPYIPIIPPSETPRSAATSQPPTPVKEQPPLYPTGFIQGEHGTLIPVYQPEALNEYMNGLSSTQNSTQAASTQHQQGAAVASMWPGYPPPPHMFAYPAAQTVGVASTASPPTTVQQQMIHQQIHGQPLQPATSASWISPGMVTATHAHTHAPQQHTAPLAAVAAHSAHPHHYASTYFNVGATVPVIFPRGGSQLGRTQVSTSERPNSNANRYPPRRDQFHYGRNSHSSGFEGMHSPSCGRPTSRSSASTQRTDFHQNNTVASSFSHRPRQGAPHLQLGINNKHISDEGHSQHQWIANHQHQQ